MLDTPRTGQTFGVRTFVRSRDRKSGLIRVLIVTRDFKVGSGLANIVLDYLRTFPRERIVVEHATFLPPEILPKKEAEKLGISTIQLKEKSIFASMSILRRLIKDNEYDLIVGTSWKPYVLAALVTKGMKTRAIAWIFGIPTAVDGAFRRYLYRILFWRQPIIFLSKAVQAAHSYGAHVGKEFIVYPGVSLLPPLYPKSMRTEIGVPESSFVIGYTAEFVEWKNHRTLLWAVAAVIQEYTALHVVLIGDGPTQKDMRQMAKALGLDAHVHFLGKRSDARELLGTFDAYIHLSDGEAFGLALAEAMLAGLPVLASTTGAFPEIISNELNGLLVSPHDVPRICEELKRIVSNSILRRELGHRAVSAIEGTFSVRKFTTALTEAFEEIASY
jgi:glycosyltransferase involved in cell wall biosynthesis